MKGKAREGINIKKKVKEGKRGRVRGERKKGNSFYKGERGKKGILFIKGREGKNK